MRTWSVPGSTGTCAGGTALGIANTGVLEGHSVGVVIPKLLDAAPEPKAISGGEKITIQCDVVYDSRVCGSALTHMQ